MIIKVEVQEHHKISEKDKKLAAQSREKQIHDAIYEKKHLDYTVKMTKQTDSEIRDMKWQPIFDAIMEETDKELDDYKGFGYSFHPMPLQIIIKTSLSKSSKDLAEKIEQYLNRSWKLKEKNYQ